MDDTQPPLPEQAPLSEQAPLPEQPPSPRPSAAAEARAASGLWAPRILALLAVVAAVMLAKAVLLPMVLAFLLNFLLRAPVGWLERCRVPRPLGAVLAIAAITTVFTIGVVQLAEPAQEWLHLAPRTLSKLEGKLRTVRKPVEEVSRAAEQVKDLAALDGGAAKDRVKVEGPSASKTFFSQVGSTVSMAVLVLFLVFFFLVFGDDLVRRMIAQLADPTRQRRARLIAEYIEQTLSRYLLTISAINACLGIGVGIIATALGMPSPWLWAAMAALLNFVPYLGAALGVVVFGAVALTSVEPVTQALLAPLLYLGLTSLEGMVVTPMIVGRRFALNPLVVLLWLLVWGWMWGIAGTLIAIPLLTIVKVLAEQLPHWRNVAAILSQGSTTST